MIYINFMTEKDECLGASTTVDICDYKYDRSEDIAKCIKEGLASEHRVAILHSRVNEILDAMEEESVDLPEHVADSVHKTLLKLKQEVNQ